jgi:hypothetical protein
VDAQTLSAVFIVVQVFSPFLHAQGTSRQQYRHGDGRRRHDAAFVV